MTAEELMEKACRDPGCDESIRCFAGKRGILCREVVLKCQALRKIEMEREEVSE